jgi:thioredoxin 1
MSNAIELTGENFETEVVKSPIPVLVDFWAEWCMPCRMLTPTLDEIAKAYEGKLKIGKINVDQQGDLASKFSIISIPTLMVFNKGESVGQHVGLAPRHALEELFKPYL